MTRFDIMAVFAQRLPVVLVPEQLWVAAMRENVVNHGRGGQFTTFFALDAQRVKLKIPLPSCTPLGVISARSGITPDIIVCVFRTMHFTVHADIAQIGAAGLATGAFRCAWHSLHLPQWAGQ